NTVTSALIAVCSTNRAPSRATCSTASDRSPDEAKTSSISACSRSVGDTRGDMGVGPSSKTWQGLRGTYALVIYTVAGARPIGPVLTAVITAEIGEVTRFKNAAQLCSWAPTRCRI